MDTPPPDAARRMAGGLHLGVLCALAAFAAYMPMYALGFKQSFWSAITALAVTQMELRAAETIGRNQFFGAAIGGVIGYLALLAAGDTLAIYPPAVLAAILACWLFNIPSASQLAGITCTIIFLVPRDGPAGEMVAARLSEVGWGVAVGIGAVWLAERLTSIHVRRLRHGSSQGERGVS